MPIHSDPNYTRNRMQNPPMKNIFGLFVFYLQNPSVFNESTTPELLQDIDIPVPFAALIVLCPLAVTCTSIAQALECREVW
jgi:hypothetical protein